MRSCEHSNEKLQDDVHQPCNEPATSAKLFAAIERYLVGPSSCQPWRLEYAEIIGRRLVCNRRLPVGSLVFEECPLAVGTVEDADAQLGGLPGRDAAVLAMATALLRQRDTAVNMLQCNSHIQHPRFQALLDTFVAADNERGGGRGGVE